MEKEGKTLSEIMISKINSVLRNEFLALTEVDNDKIYVKLMDGQKFLITVKNGPEVF